MAKYRKKPVVIEAIQFFDTKESIDEVCNFMGTVVDIVVELSKEPRAPKLEIPTLEGIHHANEGDYIIKGVKGEFYPCKPDIFAMTYEAVED